MKTIVLGLCLFGGLAMAAQTSPQFSDIARNADGSMSQMSLDDAIKYCESRGQRLPRAREFAEFASSLGAAGISQTAKYGYRQVEARNADEKLGEKVDRFYYSNLGYKRPSGDWGNHWFWSSSVIEVSSVNGFYFNGYSGGIDYNVRFDWNAVRCIRGQ